MITVLSIFAINRNSFWQDKKVGSKLNEFPVSFPVCASSDSGTFTSQEGIHEVADANLLIQIKASGQDEPNNSQYKRQVIQSNGTEILNESVGRAVRATKLRFDTVAWTVNATDVYDTFGRSSESKRLNDFLKTFKTGELLVLSTWDEPQRNASYQTSELINNFGALQTDGWAFRSAQMLIAKKEENNSGLKYEKQYNGIMEETISMKCGIDKGDVVKQVDWVATCQQSRTTFLTQENLPNCLVTADQGGTKECYKCASGYTQDAKQECITITEAETQGICKSLTGQDVRTDECSQCDQGYGNTCDEGYALADTGKCVPAIPNCDNYNCDGLCLDCLHGQFLATDDNVCVAAIDDCVKQQSDGACLECQTNHVEIEGICCDAINNCEIYGDTCGVCIQKCVDGHVESDNEVEENKVCVPALPNCISQNENETCKECDVDQQVCVDNEKVCVAEQEAHCTTYNCDGSCQTCNHGYKLISDPDSSASKCVELIDDCHEQDQSGNCGTCVAGQVVADDDKKQCVPTIDDCKLHLKDGDCLECKQGFVPLESDTCTEHVDDCIEYDCQGTCAKCDRFKVQKNNQCHDEIKWCATYENDGSCETCDDGYSLVNESCQDSNNCESYSKCSSVDKCILCKSGQKLDTSSHKCEVDQSN